MKIKEQTGAKEKKVILGKRVFECKKNIKLTSMVM